jgi:glycosyltransferase involved in cell wall biosynthesis
MSPIRATVLIPTFDNGEPIRCAIRSALAQTVEDVEVFVVGDGTTDETRDIVRDAQRADERVRFFDNPKGARHGEVHRHVALQEASGEVVCNLCDDDLWLPNHVEQMLGLLDGADFAHTMTILLSGDGSVDTWLVDLENAEQRQVVIERTHAMNLSAIGHRLDAYRRLPHGWRAAPPTYNTDHWMTRQWLAEPWVRARSGRVMTNVHPANSLWLEQPKAAKLEATRAWAEKIEDARWRRDELPQLTIDALQRSWARDIERERRFRTNYERAIATRWWRTRETAGRWLRPLRR